jgi:hypothetical protein
MFKEYLVHYRILSLIFLKYLHHCDTLVRITIRNAVYCVIFNLLLKSVETMRRLYRMTLQRSEIDSTGQIAPIRVSLTSSWLKELLIGQVLRNTRLCE